MVWLKPLCCELAFGSGGGLGTVSVHLESKASGEDGSQHGEVVAEEGAVVVAG